MKLTSVSLVVVLSGWVMSAAASSPVPLQSRERIFSTNGFSFLPPQGSDWLEQFGRNEITFLKRTDLKAVSFVTGADEGSGCAKVSSKAELVALVRSKMDKQGEAGRLSNATSSYQVEDQQGSCVRYVLTAQDRKANNKGNHAFLLLRSVGRYCVHPEDSTRAVDIFYSVRHEPEFDPKDLVAEGEDFLKGLQFSTPPQIKLAQCSIPGPRVMRP